MNTKIRKSFTLIEMLIVIVIIGILAAALVPRLQAVQSRARDTQRKTDLRTIYNAAEIYMLDFGNYPTATNSIQNCPYNITTGCYLYATHLSTPRIYNLTGIISSVPKDPINTGPGHPAVNTGTYTYAYGNVYSSPTPTFDLSAQLENRQDPDRCGVRQYRFNGVAGSPLCGPYIPRSYEYSPHSNSF